ncbi:hypothetical protein ACGFSB_36115 [Streptomyces sp. NPDC048441]|uniref:hypothetical protein n=1 Tax=Streptomyces sp. NPDC048441 TaxID=3365552 RepID=UPI00371C1ACD
MATVITYDKPGFIGHVLEVSGEIVCVLSPAAFTDAALRDRVKRLMRGQGIDCGKCFGCPIGRAK